MKHCLLSVAAGVAQAPLIKDIANLGVRVIAMDQDASAPGFEFACEFFVANILDADEIVRVARLCKVTGIVCISCDAALPAVVTACQELGLSSLTPDVVAMSGSKRQQRQALSDAGLPMPWFAVLSHVQEIKAIEPARKGIRVVVKPVDSSGSRGVSLVDWPKPLDHAVTQAMVFSSVGEVLVEAYIEGIEYSVEAWVSGGEISILACSEKVRTDPPYLLDREVHFPPIAPDCTVHLIKEQARLAIAACGYNDCPVHLECIVSGDQAYVVELAARGAGFRVFSDILKHVSGVDIARACVDTAIGVVPDLQSRHEPECASLVFIDPVPGELIEIRGLDEARSVPGISEIMVYPKPGESMNELRSGADRAGHIIAFAETAFQCRQAAYTAAEKIQLITVQSTGAAA